MYYVFQPPAPTSGAVVPSAGTAVATPSNSGAVSGVANVGIRRAEIKQGMCACVIVTPFEWGMSGLLGTYFVPISLS